TATSAKSAILPCCRAHWVTCLRPTPRGQKNASHPCAAPERWTPLLYDQVAGAVNWTRLRSGAGLTAGPFGATSRASAPSLNTTAGLAPTPGSGTPRKLPARLRTEQHAALSRGERLAEQEALRLVAAVRQQKLELLGRFHALSAGAQAQVLRQTD